MALSCFCTRRISICIWLLLECVQQRSVAIEGSVFYAADSQYLQYTGRVEKNGSQTFFEWSGVKVGILLRCPLDATSFQVHLDEPQWKWKGWLPEEEKTKYAVQVNGRRISSFSTNAKTKAYSVSLPVADDATRFVEVVKITERVSIPVLWSLSEGQPATTFHGISIPEICSVLPPPKRPSRRLEFIGDSITCGFGNLAKNVGDRAKCTFPPAGWRDYEDFGKTTASLVATTFGAELHSQCISQLGIMRNGDTLNSTTIYNASHYIHRTLPTLPHPMWDYSTWAPGVAVVNLGTNDYDLSQYFHKQPSFDDFERNYAAFLSDYVSRYAGHLSALVIACGPMTKVQCPSVEKVAARLGQEFSELTVKYVELSLNQQGGCMLHPDEAGHRSLQQALVPVISELVGWSDSVRDIIV